MFIYLLYLPESTFKYFIFYIAISCGFYFVIFQRGSVKKKRSSDVCGSFAGSRRERGASESANERKDIETEKREKRFEVGHSYSYQCVTHTG